MIPGNVLSILKCSFFCQVLVQIQFQDYGRIAMYPAIAVTIPDHKNTYMMDDPVLESAVLYLTLRTEDPVDVDVLRVQCYLQSQQLPEALSCNHGRGSIEEECVHTCCHNRTVCTEEA